MGKYAQKMRNYILKFKQRRITELEADHQITGKKLCESTEQIGRGNGECWQNFDLFLKRGNYLGKSAIFYGWVNHGQMGKSWANG